MQCWECNKEGDLKLFISNGVLYDEHCIECIFENLFGDTDTEHQIQHPHSNKSEKQLKPKNRKEETGLQKLKRQHLSFNNKIKLDMS